MFEFLSLLFGADVPWYALMGFLAIFLSVYFLFIDKNGSANHGLKYRDRWLLAHFGEEGRKRWLINYEAMNLSKGLDIRKSNTIFSRMFDYPEEKEGIQKRFIKKYPQAWDAAKRDWKAFKCLPDGICTGLPNYFYDPNDYTHDPPWGFDWQPYPCAHHDPETHNYGCYNADSKFCHGEPRSWDYFAAGRWGTVVRDDGLVVDPMKLLEAETYAHVRNEGPNCQVLDDGGKLVKRAIKAAWRHHEKTGEWISLGKGGIVRPVRSMFPESVMSDQPPPEQGG